VSFTIAAEGVPFPKRKKAGVVKARWVLTTPAYSSFAPARWPKANG
jgi:hypothetical protein